MFTGWRPIDPILSLFIVALILASSLRLLREVVHTLLEGVLSVHDLHIWSLSGDTTALSAHVILRRIEGWEVALARLRELLNGRFGISHVTLQPEPVEVVVQVARGASKRGAARPPVRPGPGPASE